MKKIPHIEFPEKYEEKNFINSPLVSIKKNTEIIIDMQYPKLGMKKAINKCFVRKEVLDKLLKAKRYLPEGYTFKIWDAYRPLELQKELYDTYKDKIIKEFRLEDLPKKDQDKIIKKYVSLPGKTEDLTPLHITGGALDLTIVNLKTGEELDMGIDFDEFSDLTNTDAYEKEGMDETIRNNRRILYYAMTKAGFTNLPTEIWHYDYGNRAWAFYKKKPAIYKGIIKLNSEVNIAK